MRPIWVRAEQAGIKSGVYFWPGSEAEVNGTRPTHWRKYSTKRSASYRANKVADWLLKDDIKLAMIYFK